MTTASLRCATLLFCLSALACGDKEDDADSGDAPTDSGSDSSDGLEGCVFGVEQGIVGQVSWKEGDWMLGTGSSSGVQRPLETTVAAFEVLQTPDVTVDDSVADAYGRYDVGSNTPVLSVSSDVNGCFTLDVPDGRYTLMADDSGAWFCNSVSTDGLCVVEVDGGTVEFDIVIDYAASY